MEFVIDCYFDRLFERMERSYLVSRFKRRQLVSFFSDVINSCAHFEDIEKSDVCERIVQAALRFHNISMADNGSVCMLGKFHNVLYIAAKLCYDWRLQNNEVVARILNDMFYCEGTFERIFVGAIYGTRVTHFLSGWKSDFDDREECIEALGYFLDHATQARLLFRCAGQKCRFIDVPIESCGQVLPIRLTIQNAQPDILLVMLRYGASIENDELTPAPVELLLGRICEYLEDDKPCPSTLLTCLRLLLRTIPTIIVRTPEHVRQKCGIDRIPVFEQYPLLVNRGIVPDGRAGITPPELRHLARCQVRKSLFANWALPHGIQQLQIPKSLQDYLNLATD